MIQVTDQRYLDQINEPFRGSFSAEVKLFFKGGTRTFTDDDIFTISESETANIVADENPTQSTEITLSNYNHEFDINGTSGYFRDISDGIECQYRFGFHVIDEDGSDDIVWLDWKRRWCSGEASLAEKQITFTVADVFSTNDDDIEGYMSSNYGLIVTNVFNKSTYPHQEDGTIGVDFDADLINTVMYYQPTYTSFNEIIQSVAFASGKQLYIDHKGVVHIDDDRTTPTGVHLGIGDYFEDNEAGKEKKVKKITVSYYVPEDSTVDPRPDFVRAMNGTGESVTVSNDFICSLEDGNRVMSYLVNYYEKRGTFECTFRGDPRLEPLDVITIDILNSDETVQTVTGTIISVENTYDGTFESTIECRYVTTDTTDDTASITGAENFVYPLDSNTPSPASVTLTCTTSINNPTKYVWEYYNMVTSAWTQIGTGSTLTIPYNTEWLSDDVTTTFRCTVNDSVSASVGIKRIYTHATYAYLGIQQTAPSNPTTGDYYLAPSGLVYLWNGQEWVTTTRSDLLINAVADGKTLTGIESTPLGQLIASMQGADGQPGADGKPGADGTPAKSLTLFADTYNFHTDAEGNVKPNQIITLTVQKQNVSDDIVWTDNKGINVPTNTLTYEFKSTIDSTKFIPENLALGYTYVGETIDSVVNTVTGSKNNIILPSIANLPSSAIQESAGSITVTNGKATIEGLATFSLSLPDGEYYYLPFYSVICSDFSKTTTSYIRADVTKDVCYVNIKVTESDNGEVYELFEISRNGGLISQIGSNYIPEEKVMVYLPYIIIVPTLPETLSDYLVNNLVIVNVTENMSKFNEMGLTELSDIQNYLDSIPYEDFNKTQPSTTLPENLVKDKVMFSDNITDESFTSGLLVNNATGNTNNYLNGQPVSLGSNTIIIQDVYDEYYTIVNKPEYKDTFTLFKDDIDLNQTVKQGTVVPFVIKGLTYGKRYYIRCNVSSEAVCMIWSWVAVDDLNNITRAKTNIAFTNNGFIIDGDNILQQYPSVVCTKEDDLSSFTLNELVVINITDNMSTFAQLGLTTEDEIREYLNTVPYDKFGTTVEGAEQGTNPALDGTPTVFTVTAGDLTSSVKIGYVQDGEQGIDGAPAKSLILTADSYNFHTDSDGNVKPDQTITITVQKQNVLDDIVWSDNKNINVPVNTTTYEFKSSVGENKFVPANLLANAKRYPSFDGEPQETGYLSNDDGSLLVQDYVDAHMQGVVKDNVITINGSNIKCVNISDGTYGVATGITQLAILGLIGTRKLYVAFESSDNIIPAGYMAEDSDTIFMAGYAHTGNRWSHILSYITSSPMSIYPTYYILRDVNVALPPSITLTKPIVIDITAYQEEFAKIGLSTDDEIRAYLDTIPYEDFVEPTYSDIQLPTNISKDIVFNTSTGEAGKIVSSNPYPMTGGELNTSRGDLSSQLTEYTVIDPRDDYSNYDYVASGTIGIIADASLVNFSHTIYMCMASSVRMDGFMQMVCTSNNEGGNIGNAVLFDFKKSKVGVFSTIGNASLPPNDDGFYSFFFTLPYVEKNDELVIASLRLRDVIIVDVDANRDTFDSLGLTTNDEIKDYLDCVGYENFGTSVKSPVATDGSSSIITINPALDGTPTIFTITAGDLSDSVQIGYVQDGNQGEAGNSIERIDTFYLATSQGSGVTVETAGWTKEPQTITSEKKYLWIYQDIYYTDNTFERVDPYITGAYGDKGDSGSAGTPTMVTLVPSAVTYELSSRNVIQKQQVITVEARISGGTGTPTWTITPTEADSYTTGKDTNTVTITLPVGSSLTGFSVSVNVTDIGEDVVYINGTPVGEPTIRFFEQRASAPTMSDNNGEPFITGDHYVTNDGVPMMYEEISNSWRQPNNGDKYYDQIMTNVGNWWLSKGNDITTSTAALYGYFRTIYSNNAIIDQLSVAGIRLQEGGIIQSTVTLPDGTVRGYEPGDGETYGTTGFYLSADGTAEFYNMSAFGIFAKGSFQADAMVTGEGTSAITQSNLYSQYQADWTTQKSYQQITNTSTYSIGDVYSMNISPDDTYAFWTSVSFSSTYKNVYAYAMGIGDATVSATRLTGIENAIEGLNSTNYESVSRCVGIRRNSNGYQAVVVGGVSGNYTQRITVIDTTSASATATTHEYTKTNNPVQFVTIPIFTDTQLLLYNAGSGVDLSSFGNYAEYQIGIADIQSDGGNYSFSWGASSAQSNHALWGKGTEFELADIQNWSSMGGVYDAVNDRVWIWFVGNGKMFPTEFKSSNWRQGARFRQNDYTWDGTTPISDDFNDIKTSTYNDYIATDNGMTVITYGNNTAWEIIEINENDAWSMQSFDFGSTRYGFMGWDGTYVYGKNLSTNRMYRGTKNDWSNNRQTDLGYTITSNIVGKYLVDGDILSWSSNVKRTTHGQRMDNIISFFSQLLPKINPSTMSHMPESEPLASVTACTGNVKIAGTNKTIVRMGCSSSTLTIDTNSGSYVYKSGVLYDDTETVEITSLTISAKAASIDTKTILPQDNNSYDIGSSGKVYRTIYCTTLFAYQLGSGSDKVYRIYADYIGESSNKTTTIYTTNLYLGSYSRGTTGYTPLPNGLLLQWGRVNTTTANRGTVSFLRTFGTLYTVVTAMHTNSSTADNYVLTALVTSTSNSSFEWYKTYANRNTSGGASEPFNWIAIGSS